jgi:hypothetical protein
MCRLLTGPEVLIAVTPSAAFRRFRRASQAALADTTIFN